MRRARAEAPRRASSPVGTQRLAEVGSADMHYVYNTARAVVEVVEEFTVIAVN